MPRLPGNQMLDLGSPGVDAPDFGGNLNWSPRENWVDRVAGLPRYIDRIAGDLIAERGHTRAHAIRLAIGIVRNWCHGHGGKVTAATRAKACAAAAEWEAKKAAAHVALGHGRGAHLTAEERHELAIDLCRRAEQRTIELTAGLPDDVIDLAPSAAERKRAESKGQAMRGGRFPVRNISDLKKAIRAVGRARPNTEAERAKVRRYIRRRARALNATHLIPSSWSSGGSLK